MYLKEKPNKHKGSALISALFIMTLVAIATTAMATRLQIELYKTRIKLNSNSIYLASEAALFWAMQIMADPKNQFLTINKQGQVAAFPKQYKSFYPNVIIEAGIYDAQGLLNLNNLEDAKEVGFFARSLESIVPELADTQKKDLIQATQDWISFYDPEKGEDPYLSYYLHQKPPYNISHQRFHSVSEFRLVQGVSAKIYNKLAPFIIALPEKTALNLNTASPQLLQALGNGLTKAQVTELIQARGKNGIAQLDQVRSLLEKNNIRPEQITLKSYYFLVVSTITTEKMRRQTFSLFKRKINKAQELELRLITNTINTL